MSVFYCGLKICHACLCHLVSWSVMHFGKKTQNILTSSGRSLLIKRTVFGCVMPCSLVGRFKHFKGTCCHHLWVEGNIMFQEWVFSEQHEYGNGARYQILFLLACSILQHFSSHVDKHLNVLKYYYVLYWCSQLYMENGKVKVGHNCHHVLCCVCKR